MIGGRIEKSCWKAGKERRFRFVAEESDAEERKRGKKNSHFVASSGEKINIDKPFPSDFCAVSMSHFFLYMKGIRLVYRSVEFSLTPW